MQALQAAAAKRTVERTLPLIGVLGGMGPAATADFHHKLVASTPASCDQDHLPLLIRAVPQIPDRAAAILARGPSPEPALVAHALHLQAAGAAVVVMPCNTAHLWHAAVERALRIPVLHIVDAVLDHVERRFGAKRRLHLGVLATSATVRARLYPSRAEEARPDAPERIRWLHPQARQQAELVDGGIRAVKGGDMAAGRALLGQAAHELIARGADGIVLACTEIPLVLERLPVPAVDSTEVLAQATVEWALGEVIRDS